jgi:hypothetical protein
MYTGHTYGKMTDTMDITTGKNGNHLNTMERYHIHIGLVGRNCTGMTHIDTYNPIFEKLQGVNTK